MLLFCILLTTTFPALTPCDRANGYKKAPPNPSWVTDESRSELRSGAKASSAFLFGACKSSSFLERYLVDTLLLSNGNRKPKPNQKLLPFYANFLFNRPIDCTADTYRLQLKYRYSYVLQYQSEIQSKFYSPSRLR